MNTAQTIYEKFQKGAELTDLEIKVGIAHFQKLADLAFSTGAVFRLMAREAQHVAAVLREMRDARAYVRKQK